MQEIIWGLIGALWAANPLQPSIPLSPCMMGTRVSLAWLFVLDKMTFYTSADTTHCWLLRGQPGASKCGCGRHGRTAQLTFVWTSDAASNLSQFGRKSFLVAVTRLAWWESGVSKWLKASPARQMGGNTREVISERGYSIDLWWSLVWHPFGGGGCCRVRSTGRWNWSGGWQPWMFTFCPCLVRSFPFPRSFRVVLGMLPRSPFRRYHHHHHSRTQPFAVECSWDPVRAKQGPFRGKSYRSMRKSSFLLRCWAERKQGIFLVSLVQRPPAPELRPAEWKGKRRERKLIDVISAPGLFPFLLRVVSVVFLSPETKKLLANPVGIRSKN